MTVKLTVCTLDPEVPVTVTVETPGGVTGPLLLLLPHPITTLRVNAVKSRKNPAEIR